MPADTRKSLMTSLPVIATIAVGMLLLVFAGLRWQENGWGALAWLLALCGMILIRTPHSLRNRRNAIVDDRRDTMEAVLLLAMFLTSMLLPLLHLTTGIFSFANYRLPDWATGIGAAAQIPFLWLFWRSHADLGRNWSPGLEVRSDHGLVTDGIYARMRNPMYAAIWISALAQPLLIHNWIAGFLVVPAFAAMWFIRVPREEAMMRARFGVEWDTYCRRTGRLLPAAAR